MFDWDNDVDSLTRRNVAPLAEPTVEKTGALRSLASRWLAPVAVVIGLAAAGQSVFDLDLLPTNQAVSLSSAGGLRAALFQTVEDTAPVELIIYQDMQYASFMRGIVQFKDADLLSYASATARELETGDDLMVPYQLDALWLTNREIERRGLTRQTQLASYEAERESFRATQQDL